MQVVLYTRKTCPLCEEVKDMLTALQHDLNFSVIEKDIYSDERLLEQFHLMIPVIEIDGEVVMYGKIQRKNIRKRLLYKNAIR